MSVSRAETWLRAETWAIQVRKAGTKRWHYLAAEGEITRQRSLATQHVSSLALATAQDFRNKHPEYEAQAFRFWRGHN